MAGIPTQHAAMASGFLMTGHEIGAALGAAVLAAVATAGGDLTTPTGAATGFSSGFLAAAGITVGLAVFAFLAMPLGAPPVRRTCTCTDADCRPIRG